MDKSGLTRRGVAAGQADTSIHVAAPHDDAKPRVDDKPGKPGASSLLTVLSQDGRQIFLLVALYLLQGVPVGLTFGSVPFLLQQRMSYSDLAVFSLSSYPYSLKLLWSPIVDAVWMRRLGRRKTWIIPSQLLIALTMLWMSTSIDSALSPTSTEPVRPLATAFFVLIVVVATQDIAVDGWALTLLSPANRGYASTCQNIGLTMGSFLSFTVFLALNSPDFSNQYLRSVPQDLGVLQMSTFLRFWAIAYLAVTAALLLFIHEDGSFGFALTSRARATPTDDELSVWDSYKQLVQVILRPAVLHLTAVLLISRLGFAVGENLTAYRLIERGFPKETFAMLVVVQFPLQILSSVIAGRYASRTGAPLSPWLGVWPVRMLLSSIAVASALVFPEDLSKHIPTYVYVVVMLTSLALNFTASFMFVAQGCLFSAIADPKVGGAYITFLWTASNFGGTWPKTVALWLVDDWTRAECIIDGEASGVSCATKRMREDCLAHAGAVCNVEADGFYTTAIVTSVVAIAVFLLYVRRTSLWVQSLPLSAWRITSSGAVTPSSSSLS